MGLKADGGQLMEEGRGVEGGGGTDGLGPDPTVLTDFFRHSKLSKDACTHTHAHANIQDR